MDLAQPLSSLIPSLEGEALTVLARTEQPLTGRQVAGLARRGTHPAVQKVLDRLVRQGVVDVQPAGRARLYQLNRDHLLTPSVIAGVTARETLLRRLRQAIECWQLPCTHASMFGSLVRGEADAESDLDVLVVRPASLSGDDAVWQQQLHALEHSVLRWTGNRLSWFETTEADLARGLAGEEEPLIAAWRHDALQLAGEPLRQLLARVSATLAPSTSVRGGQ